MKVMILISWMFFVCTSCATSQNTELKFLDDVDQNGKTEISEGTIKISNPKIEYEVIIFDNLFESWFFTNARPRGYYSKSYLESKNRIWVSNFNTKARSGKFGFDYTIDYQSNIDYGYEVNYMLYYYLLYYQQTNQIKLDY